MTKDAEKKRPWWSRFVGSEELASTEAFIESLQGELERLTTEVSAQKEQIELQSREREAAERQRLERDARYEQALEAARAALKKEQEVTERVRAARDTERSRAESEAAALRQKAVEVARQVDGKIRALEQECAARKAEAVAAHAASLRDSAAVRADAQVELAQRDTKVRAMEQEYRRIAEQLGQAAKTHTALQDAARRAHVGLDTELQATRQTLVDERTKHLADTDALRSLLAEERTRAASRLEALSKQSSEERAALEAFVLRMTTELEQAAATREPVRAATRSDTTDTANLETNLARVEGELALRVARTNELVRLLELEQSARRAAEVAAGWAGDTAQRFSRIGVRALRQGFGRAASLPLRRALRDELPDLDRALGADRTVEGAASWLESNLRCAGVCEAISVREATPGFALEVRFHPHMALDGQEMRDDILVWLGELVRAVLTGIATNVRMATQPNGDGTVRFVFDRSPLT